MAKLTWDEVGERLYETGVSNGVLFVQKSDGTYNKGVAWNGLTSVNHSPEGAEKTDLWADNTKYLSLRSAEDLNFTINAYMSPEEFDECDGSVEVAPGVTIGQQKRAGFSFSYKTIVGNDTAKDDYGYKIYIYYGCSASPSERENSTVNDSPEATELSWECSATPINIPGHKPSASITIHSNRVPADKLAAFEKIIYGDAETEARLPTPEEIITLFAATTGVSEAAG